jgi:hypothetical protein
MVGVGWVPAAPGRSQLPEEEPPKKIQTYERPAEKRPEDKYYILWSVPDPVSVSLYLVVMFYIILYIDSIFPLNGDYSERYKIIQLIQAASRFYPSMTGHYQ